MQFQVQILPLNKINNATKNQKFKNYKCQTQLIVSRQGSAAHEILKIIESALH